MKAYSKITSLLAIILFGTAAAAADQFLYLASNRDRNIAGYAVDDETGALVKKFSVFLPGKPGPMAFSPDQSFVYASLEDMDNDQVGMATLSRAGDGTLRLLITSAITSRSDYIRTDLKGRYLLAAHYFAGEVTVYRIVDGLCTDELLSQIKTARTAHSIELDRSGRYVYVPHTSPNNVYQFRFDEATGKLTANDPPFVDGPEKGHRYHAPRHYIHHPTLDMGYTSNESGGGITAWKFNPADGTLTRVQTLSTLPPNYQGRSASADIRLTPDGRFAYVSNRDDDRNRAEGVAPRDTLAAIALDPRTGAMKMIGTFPTVHFPRSFCIDLTGRFVYATGERSSNLFTYRIDQATGQLEHIATYETGGAPMWVMCGKLGR